MRYREQRNTATLTPLSADASGETKDNNDALFDMIEESMKVLTEKLAGQSSPSELRAGMESLSNLVEALNLRAEFIAKLLDKNTSARLRDSLRSSVLAMQIEPQLAGQEMLSKSNDLIKMGASLIAMAQERINKDAHREAGYVLKFCGLCAGSSGVPEGSCVVCKGRGSLVVRDPAVECSRCEGNGRARAYDKAVRYSSLCAQCKGTGWVTSDSV